jgi:integrase
MDRVIIMVGEMVGEIAEIIARRRAERRASCPYVFHRESQRIISHYRAWRTARKKAGQPQRHLHDAHRTVARNMNRAGVPRQVAKQIIGHKTDAMYNRYRIVNEQDIREGMVQAETFLARHNLGHQTDTEENPKT